MTHDEFQAIKARHQHDHAKNGGETCPDCWEEADVNALIAEVERLRETLRNILPAFDDGDRTYGGPNFLSRLKAQIK